MSKQSKSLGPEQELGDDVTYKALVTLRYRPSPQSEQVIKINDLQASVTNFRRNSPLLCRTPEQVTETVKEQIAWKERGQQKFSQRDMDKGLG
jgi:hypothetical protein